MPSNLDYAVQSIVGGKLGKISFDVDGGIAIGEDAKTTYDNVAVGVGADGTSGGSGHVIVGSGVQVNGEGCTAVGAGSSAGGVFSVALGNGANASGNLACQIGQGENDVDNTVKLFSYRLTSVDDVGAQFLTDVGQLTDLQTAAKGNLVEAVNELAERLPESIKICSLSEFSTITNRYTIPIGLYFMTVDAVEGISPTADNKGKRIMYNDEVGYRIDGDFSIIKGNSYLCRVVSQPISTIDDKVDGVLEIYASDNKIENNYSEKPVRIGTWMDGTPVWRVAFEIEIPHSGSEVDVNIEFLKTDDNVRLLDYRIWSTCDNNIVDTADRTSDSYTDSNGIHVIFTNSSPENVLFGFIEFVTPESNLKK